MLKKFIKKVKNYDIISFDIFDTLINRVVCNPKELFYLVAKKYYETVDSDISIQEICNERLQAEITARNKKRKEITIEDIYINFSNNIKTDILKKLEIEAEFELCYANNEIVDILNYCHKMGKKIIIVSDMYLNYETISFILKKNNIVFDDLFVSSEYGVTKSNGGLFKIVSQKYANKKIIHIGDNIKSDYLMPKIYGIESIKYKKTKKLDVSNEEYYINSFCNMKKFDDNYYEYGYNCLGPLMYGFSEFLDSKVNKKDILFFLAREGKFIKKCFDTYCNNSRETKYMYVSRKSVTKYCISSFKSFEELKNNISLSKNEDVETFLKRISSFKKDIIEKLNDEKISLTDSFYNEKVQNFLKNNYKILSKDNDNLLKKYLEKLEFNKNSIIVDIGWAGSMQDLLSQVLNHNIYGYYFGVRSARKNEFKNGFVYNGDDEKTEMKSRNFNGLFEIVMSANHGTTIDYSSVNNNIEPVLIENDIPDTVMQLIEKIQFGAIKFIEDFKQIKFKYEFNHLDYQKKFCNSGYNPTKENIELFKDFYVYDEKKYKLIENKGIVFYLLNPKKFLYDYKESGWKSAFMKKNFGFHFNFLYSILYKLDKKGEKR